MRLYNDQTISQAVRHHLACSDGIEHSRIWVSTSGGITTLRGTVDSLGEWHLADETARGVYGVCAVINELVVRGPGGSRVA